MGLSRKSMQTLWYFSIHNSSVRTGSFPQHVPGDTGTVRKQMLIKLYIPQWMLDDVKTKTMMTPCQKNERHVFMYSTDQYKESTPGAAQYCRIRVDYLRKMRFPSRCTAIDKTRSLCRQRYKLHVN